VPQELRQRIAEDNRLDIELYRHAVRLVDARDHGQVITRG
jgi:hypothetical protein